MRAGTQTALLVGSIAVVVALVAVLQSDHAAARDSTTHLRLYCAAGIRPPVERIARDYGKAYGVRVDITYGGSGTLLSSLRIKADADLYLAADDSYLERARDFGLVAEVLSIARMRPVIGVARGNPLGIERSRDLLRGDVRTGMANPDAAAVGRIARDRLRSSGIWKRVERHLRVLEPTVTDLANDIVLGALDAAIIWDATANQYGEIDFVRDPVLDAGVRDIAVGVLESSRAPRAALRFARYLSAADRGQPVFDELGYVPTQGDAWSVEPELVLYAGAMLSKAIDASITEFETREGCRVTRVYNGCGILVAQMKAGRTPDAYFACDDSFLEMVAPRFEPGQAVSSNRIGIAVPRTAPVHIRAVRDLAKPGLRVGIAHPVKSALGALTDRLLDRLGVRQALEPNVRVESPTGDFLVNQLRAGALDAAIVYRSNAAGADSLDFVPIDDPTATAKQPFARANDSRYKNLMQRLLDHIRARKSRFDALGFVWHAGEHKR